MSLSEACSGLANGAGRPRLEIGGGRLRMKLVPEARAWTWGENIQFWRETKGVTREGV